MAQQLDLRPFTEAIYDQSLIEDEAHFLLTCNIYANLRNELLDKVEEILSDEPLVRTDNQLMMRYLLGNTKIAPIVAKYLNKTKKIRDFLIENPRRLM